MTEPTEERPLVTFALFAYNQERFIREAVEGALAQTYSPLQVILSDDCSSDRTFAIMQEMVVDYSGPHEILLNRNERNLGIGGHVNRVMELAQGELIVVAAGDDISFPERTSIMVNEWVKLGKKIVSLHSSVIIIDESGQEKECYNTEHAANFLSPKDFVTKNIVIGASHAWTKSIFEFFGEIDCSVTHEDRVISFRSSLMDGVFFIDKPLLKYRQGGIADLGEFSKTAEDYLYQMIKVRSSRYYWDCYQQIKDFNKLGKPDKLLEKLMIGKYNENFFLMQLSRKVNPYSLFFYNIDKISLSIIKKSLKYFSPYLYKFFSRSFK